MEFIDVITRLILRLCKFILSDRLTCWFTSIAARQLKGGVIQHCPSTDRISVCLSRKVIGYRYLQRDLSGIYMQVDCGNKSYSLRTHLPK